MSHINVENIGVNTYYCSDSDANDEFKCQCNTGFDGKRCEDECLLECENDETCTSQINGTTGYKQWECKVSYQNTNRGLFFSD